MVMILTTLVFWINILCRKAFEIGRSVRHIFSLPIQSGRFRLLSRSNSKYLSIPKAQRRRFPLWKKENDRNGVFMENPTWMLNRWRNMLIIIGYNVTRMLAWCRRTMAAEAHSSEVVINVTRLGNPYCSYDREAHYYGNIHDFEEPCTVVLG